MGNFLSGSVDSEVVEKVRSMVAANRVMKFPVQNPQGMLILIHFYSRCSGRQLTVWCHVAEK
jgi:hypothetical protein